MKKKRILIAYATYGTGHRSIANCIKEHFDKTNEYEILVVDLVKYSTPFLGVVSQKFAENLILKRPILWNIIYTLFDTKVNSYVSNKVSMQLFNNKAIKNVICNFKPDITISTHFFASSLISKYNRKGWTNSKLITIVTDYKAHQFWLKNVKYENAIIVSGIEEKIDLMSKGVSPFKIKTYGMPISDRFCDVNHLNKAKIMKRYGLKGDKLIALFYGGGGLGNLNSLNYLKKLITKNINLDILFVSGKNEELKNKALELKKKYHANNLKVFGFVSNGHELTYISDFVITKPGGVTITECLVQKKPMLLFKRVGGQEKGNYYYLTRKGYAKGIDNIFKFETQINDFIEDKDTLARMNKNLSRLENNQAMNNLEKLTVSLLKDKK